MSRKSNTAMAAALKAAGHASSEERLASIADAAVADHPRTLDLARQHIFNVVAGDAALLWCMFSRWRNMAADLLLQEAAARARAARTPIKSSEATSAVRTTLNQPQAGAGSPQQAAGQAAYATARVAALGNAAVTIISKLDTVRINGRAIGDCTPEEAAGWCDARSRDIRFIELLTQNLPPGRPIREFIRADEANALYQRAQQERDNA